MDRNKTSKRDFEKVLEKQAQERWYKISQLSKEGRAEVEAMDKAHKKNLAQEIMRHEMNFKKDTEQEFNRLLKKDGLELHYRPVWGQGNILSEQQLKKLAQHNVITKNREVIQGMEGRHNKAVEATLNKEGLFLSKGDSKTNLPNHFNERGLTHQKDRDKDHSRGR